MKINCKRKRQGGTRITIGRSTYHFAPQPDGQHVAEVSDPAHIKTLLGIDAYEIASNEPEAEPVEPVAPVQSDPDGTRVEPVVPDDPTPINPDPSQVTAPGADTWQDWAEGQAEGGEKVDQPMPPIEEMTQVQLIEAYEAEYDRAPHPAAKPETLRAKLIEARDRPDE